MAERDVLIVRNDFARLLEPHSRRERNSVRVNVGSSLHHELGKFYMNWKLRKQEFETVTECRFKKNSARGDVFELDDGTLYEIIYSESEERFLAKLNYYPSAVVLVAVKAEDLIREMFLELETEAKRIVEAKKHE